MGSSGIDEFVAGMLDITNEFLALTEYPRRTAELAAPKLRQVIMDEFDRGTAPDGTPWAPLATGQPAHLVRTGDTRSRTRVIPMGLKVYGKLGNYMNIHQNSKGREPQRKAVLRGNELTGPWLEAMEEAAKEAIQELAPKLTEGGVDGK